MRQKLQILILVIIFALPLFLHGFTYLSDDEFKALSKGEKANYIAALETEMVRLQQERSDNQAAAEELDKVIAELKTRLAETDNEIGGLYDELGITEEDFTQMYQKIQYYKDQLANWERMSDDDLWKNAKAFRELREDYDKTHNQRLARLPEFQRDFNELDRRFNAVASSIDRISKSHGYYEDSYIVQRGDTLPKISGYDHIYDDTTKWGIIYRANRDQIGRNHVVQPGWNLKIPRGLPTSWKVYTGESLWKISQYPEVYGTGKKWPTIYRANQDKIKDPNLIYPNQVFTIPRDN